MHGTAIRHPKVPRYNARVSAGPRRHPPDDVPDVVRDKERTRLVDRDTDRSPHRLPIFPDETSQHIDGLASRHPAREWNEDYSVAATRFSIPRSVLSYEHPAGESGW